MGAPTCAPYSEPCALVIALARRGGASAGYHSLSNTSIPNLVAIPRAGGARSRQPRLSWESSANGRALERSCRLSRSSTVADPEARLVLAGDGDVVGVRSEARRVGVGDRVDVPGWIGPERRTGHSAAPASSPCRHARKASPWPCSRRWLTASAVVSPVGRIPDSSKRTSRRLRASGRSQTLLRVVWTGFSMIRMPLGGWANVRAPTQPLGSATEVVALQIGDALVEAMAHHWPRAARHRQDLANGQAILTSHPVVGGWQRPH